MAELIEFNSKKEEEDNSLIREIPPLVLLQRLTHYKGGKYQAIGVAYLTTEVPEESHQILANLKYTADDGEKDYLLLGSDAGLAMIVDDATNKEIVIIYQSLETNLVWARPVSEFYGAVSLDESGEPIWRFTFD